MSTGFFTNPAPINEPIYSYAKGSAERIRLQETIAELRGQQIDISMRIGGRRSGFSENVYGMSA